MMPAKAMTCGVTGRGLARGMLEVSEPPRIGQKPEISAAPEDYADPEPFCHTVSGNQFTFYPRGQDRLDALVGLIDEAQASLKLFYYMFRADESGRRVMDALERAVARGVNVELLIDSFGSDREVRLFDAFVAAGGRFTLFMARYGTRYLIRNHQKMAIADDRAAMIGGFNITDHYFAPPTQGGWHDMGLKLEGQAVAQLVRWFGQLAEWARDRDENFRAIRALVRNWRPDQGPIRLLLGGPTRIPSGWARQVKRDIAVATRLDLVMAYFSPPRSYRRLIAQVAQRGKARLVLAGKSDNNTTIAASRALYRKLLKAGVEIQEFMPTKMHTKLLVADDITYVGSANFDMRSLRLNLELMMRIEDAGLAEKLRAYIDSLVPHSCQITLADHRRHASLWNRLRWWTGWMLVGVLDYTVARRLNLGP